MVNSFPKSTRGDKGFGNTGVSVVHPIFFFFFYIHLTPHSPTGMAGGSPRLTNTCAPTTTAAS